MQVSNKYQQFSRQTTRFSPSKEEQRTKPSGGGSLTHDFPGRDGYDENFLGAKLPLPELDASVRDQAAPLKSDPNKIELEYTHYSVIQNKDRRTPFLTAANVDGAQYNEVARDGKWGYDSRIETKYQMGEDAYKNNDIDKGHMTRRRDPMWGNDAQANAGSDDTFVYTNCSLQHSKLNQHQWLNLENFLLERATTEKKKMSVFTGPVLRSDDPKFDNHGKMSSPTQIPTAFWKVAVWNEPGKGLVGEGYVMSQADILKGNSSGALIELTKPEDFKPFRVSLENIEKMTSIHFGPIKDQSVQ